MFVRELEWIRAQKQKQLLTNREAHDKEDEKAEVGLPPEREELWTLVEVAWVQFCAAKVKSN